MAKHEREHYKKSLERQVILRLNSLFTPGRSREEDKREGLDAEHIYAYKTYYTYKQQSLRFVEYLQRQHPECTALRYARGYYGEYMRSLEAQGYAASSLHTANSALCKLLGIGKGDRDFYSPPKRYKEEFVRSRGEKAWDKHFSEEKNRELVEFQKGVGARRAILEQLTGDDYYSRSRLLSELERLSHLRVGERSEKEQIYLETARNLLSEGLFSGYDDFVFHYRDKHGKSRLSPIIGPRREAIVARFRATGSGERVWLHIPAAMDVHSYRGDYATAFYRENARRIEDIPFDRVNKGSGCRYQSGVYTCRGEDAGKKLDRSALALVSKALGHNRLDVVPKNYLKGD